MPISEQSIDFSVIIPTYNRLELAVQAVDSVKAQDYSSNSYEILVVDDGSSDGTSECFSRDARVKLFYQPRKGPGAARNLGVQHARGNYVAFLDSDDIWFPWTLRTFRSAIDHHGGPSLICAATLEFRGAVPKIEKNNLSMDHFADFFATSTSPSYVGSGALAVKRDVFKQLGGFDETMSVGEDLDFYLRAGVFPDFVRISSPVTLAYRRHDGNVSTASKALYLAGVEILTREAMGDYPGSATRHIDRWVLISRALRPITMSCLRDGLPGEAWQLFRGSFSMNARLGRVRFLVGFIVYGFLNSVYRTLNSSRLPILESLRNWRQKE
jgi:glycosyltransferase involved in cell wall biosynthesis